MTYTLGTETTFKMVSGQIVIKDTKNAYVGFRAFARNEKTGTYREVLGLSKEDGMYVDGTFEGSMITHTHDTREDAVRQASKAYRWLNK